MSLRINVGCGDFPLAGFHNVDADPTVDPDVCARVPPLPFESASAVELYAGHFLEHLTPQGAEEFLRECYRVLQPGGRLGIVIPDTVEVFRRYLSGAVDEIEYPAGTWWPVKDLDTLNHIFVYSDVQPTPHRWLWDINTLARAMTRAGFVRLARINRFSDVRLGSPAWYQDGLDGYKPE